MTITLKSVLAAAGIADEGPIQVLRDGFPSFVVRVATNALNVRQDNRGTPSMGNAQCIRQPVSAKTVILKACPDSSREPDIMLTLHGAKLPVPAVMDVKEGEGFRVIIMEDVGSDVLHKHPTEEWYMEGVKEIAKVHRRYDDAWMDEADESRRIPAGDRAFLMVRDLVPVYGRDTWESVVLESAGGTVRRIKDGIYLNLTAREKDDLLLSIDDMVTNTLSKLWTMYERGLPPAGEPVPGLPRTLIHGDYHDGNVLVRYHGDGLWAPDRFAVVDWDSARIDSGFFDLVSLYDVADRMGTCHLDPMQLMETYMLERWLGGWVPSDEAMEKEWRRCRILRAWDELRWFSTTGEDFGERVRREVKIIREELAR